MGARHRLFWRRPTVPSIRRRRWGATASAPSGSRTTLLLRPSRPPPGAVTAHVLLRPLATRASNDVRIGLYHLAWRIQVSMVYLGSGLLLVTGVLLWFGRFKLLTGWLLLGFLLYVAAAGLDGAFLSPNLRRTRASLKTGTPDAPEPAAATIQVITWFLLAVVVFLLTALPF